MSTTVYPDKAAMDAAHKQMEDWHEAQRGRLKAEAEAPLSGPSGIIYRNLDGVPTVAIHRTPKPGECPAHYAGAVTPWDLQKCMKSSGNAFVDAKRCDVIEYAYRIKDDLLGDLIKARHCLDEAITVLKAEKNK